MNITSLIDVINSENPVNKIYTSPIERFTDNDNILSDRIFAFSLLESHEQLEFISDLCSV